MAKNKALHTANKAKKDEFYTQMADIEKEMRVYTRHFKDKIIFCNCDDPQYSNFWKYFELNFENLGLKKLIATHFDETKPTYKLELLRAEKSGKGGVELRKSPLRQNGDFRSPESVAILKEADVVITNPPFSLFREYMDQLFEHDKKFIIIGNVNAITYKNVFPRIAANLLWLGHSIHSGDREFRVPNDYPLTAVSSRVDENGVKYVRIKGVRWFTNLDYQERHEDLPLCQRYTPEKYPQYDNYQAINVDKTNDIPIDYDGVMGVPITFLDKFNPEQFEIVAFRKGDDGKDLVYSRWGKFEKGIIAQADNDATNKSVSRQIIQPYFRILIRRRQNQADTI